MKMTIGGITVSNRKEDFLATFRAHRKVTNDLIALIDEKKLDFAPTDTSMPVGKLANHILEATYTFALLANDQSPAKLFDDDDNTELKSKASTYTQETEKLIASMSEEDFDKTIDVSDMLGEKLPAEKVLETGMHHEIHHKGQLFVYVRAMGHDDLPYYVSL